ncbi:BOF domain-containing protein [Burkholderia multivorans]
MRQLPGLLIAALAALPATGAYAQYTGPSTLTAMTVQQLLAGGKDDQHVVLRGRIVKHVGGEDYEFVDATGTIRVEIDEKLWAGMPAVDDKHEVKLTGEFEKKWSGAVKVDAERIEVLR